MTYKVGKYEYREFCSDFVLINESLINADSPKEAVNFWLEKDVKVFAIKEVTKEKAQNKAQEKKFIVQTTDKDENEQYFHVLQVPLLNIELDSILKGARI